MSFLAPVQGAGSYAHELPTFRGHLPAFLQDDEAEVNIRVVSFELVAFNHPYSSTMHEDVYRDSETGQLFTFLTTVMNLAPDLVALLSLLRWRIEKVFDIFKNKLHEQKAWGNGPICQQIQAHFACMTHNLILFFQAGLKRDLGIDPLNMHKKSKKALQDREEKAGQARRIDQPVIVSDQYPNLVFMSIDPVSSKRH